MKTLATMVAPKRARSPVPTAEPDSRPSRQPEAGAVEGWPLFLGRGEAAPVVQAKLVVGQPDDEFEREADRMAREVVAGDQPQRTAPGPQDQVQRRTGEEGRKRPAPSARGRFAGDALPQPPRTLPGGAGEPLPEAIRSRVEPVIGADLSRVRVHDGPAAHAAAARLQAKAFTYRQDIWLGAGQSAQNIELLAHEATHVAQQTRARTPPSPVTTTPVPATRRAEGIIQRTNGGGGSAASPTVSEGPAGAGPPALWGLDTTTRRLYLSVTIPGHTLAEVATYVYGSPDGAADLAAANAGLPEFLPPGTTLRLPERPLADDAVAAANAALDQGTILRTEGVPSAGEGETLVYRFSAAGKAFELTDGQFRAMLRGLAVWIVRKATYLRNRARDGLEVQRDHVENTNSVVRGISNLIAGQDVPSELIWDVAERGAQRIIDNLGEAEDPTAEEVGRNARMLQIAAESLDHAFRTWHEYIEGTISGAEGAVHALEITRNVSFGIAAGIAGVVAAPVVFTAATAAGASTAVATGAALVAGTGAGAATGGGLEFVGAAGGEALGTAITPGAEFDWGYVGERTTSGLRSGAVSGGLGAAGALAAPAVSGAISARLFGTAPGALTGFGARAAVNVLTGVTLGAPLGGAGAAIDSLPDLAGGRITAAEYLSRIGWSSLFGGIFGGAFGLIHTAFSRPGPSALARPTPEPAGGRGPWTRTAPEVNTATGEVRVMARHGPTGEVFEARFNPATGNGSLTRLATGEVIHIRGGAVQPPPSGLLPTAAAPTGVPAAPGPPAGTWVPAPGVGGPALGPRPSVPALGPGTPEPLRFPPAPPAFGSGSAAPVPAVAGPAAPSAAELGRAGELSTIAETGRGTPPRFSRLLTSAERARLYGMIERGEISLRELGQMLGPRGAEQVYFRTPLGGRWIDYVFSEGDVVVLRESKNVSDFAVTPFVRLQLAKDLYLLSRHPEARVNWRISGNGMISGEAYRLLEATRELTGGRFTYQIPDTAVPGFSGPTSAPPTLH